jgi:hypothetical protein
VDVVGHQTVGDDGQVELAASFDQQGQIVEAVGFIMENIKSPGAPLGDMVRHPRHDKACGS